VEREEAEVVAGADRVPDALLERVQPLAGRAELHPVARLRTRRRVIDLLREGSRLAELVEDDVVVLAGSGSEVARFHELEIEVLGGLSEAELDALVRALQASGAVLDSTAKYARALDALGLAAARQPLD